MKTALSSLKRTAVSVTTCKRVCKQPLPPAVAWRSSKLTVVLNLKNLKTQGALWVLFYGGRRESEMRKRVEPSKVFYITHKFRASAAYLAKKSLIGTMEYWSSGVMG
jgi:hypothetical protein